MELIGHLIKGSLLPHILSGQRVKAVATQRRIRTTQPRSKFGRCLCLPSQRPLCGIRSRPERNPERVRLTSRRPYTWHPCSARAGSRAGSQRDPERDPEHDRACIPPRLCVASVFPLPSFKFAFAWHRSAGAGSCAFTFALARHSVRPERDERLAWHPQLTGRSPKPVPRLSPSH